MEKNQILDAVQYLRNNSPKRKFSQNFDLLINLKDLNLKNEAHKVNTFTVLPHEKGKKIKIAALVGQELLASAKTSCDKVILKDEFDKYNKKAIRGLAKEYAFFIAQATLMSQIAGTFGKVLGPRGKMPNPKAGCVVPPTANLKPLVENLQKTVKLETKNELILRCVVGDEVMKDEQVADNILHIYNTAIHSVPQEKNNIKNVMLKLTMGPAVNIENLPKEEKKEGKQCVNCGSKLNKEGFCDNPKCEFEGRLTSQKSKKAKVKEDGERLQAKSA
ncbi:MAG: 50S ribosomal protein L1 [Nanoarchaeota archaeon]